MKTEAGHEETETRNEIQTTKTTPNNQNTNHGVTVPRVRQSSAVVVAHIACIDVVHGDQEAEHEQEQDAHGNDGRHQELGVCIAFGTEMNQ